MWKRSYQKTFEKVTENQIWDVLTDINNWATWQPDLKYCKLLDVLKEGSYFELKPKKGPAVRIKIIKLQKPTYFEDCTQFVGAKMHGIHHIEKVDEGVKITTTMKVVGPLGFFWRKLIAEDIIDHEPEQMELMVQRAKHKK